MPSSAHRVFATMTGLFLRFRQVLRIVFSFVSVNIILVSESMSPEQQELWGPRRSIDFSQGPPSPDVTLTPPPPTSPHVARPASPDMFMASPRRSGRAAVANTRFNDFGKF